MEPTTKLESKMCGRCGGTGRHSYNSFDKDVCYGCMGSGVRYTKRGRAAKAYLDELMMVPASTIKVGDLVRVQMGMTLVYFARVTKVGPDDRGSKWMKDGVWVPYYSIQTEHLKHGEGGINLCSPEDLVRKGFTGEENAALYRKALEYQATLTTAGKPRKRARTPAPAQSSADNPGAGAAV